MATLKRATHSKPRLNFKSRLLTSFCCLAQFAGRGGNSRSYPFADEKFELVSCHPSRFPSTPFSPARSCHRRGLHRIFMSPCAPFLPHIYATAACHRPDMDLARETFSTLALPAENPQPARSDPFLFEDDASCSIAV